jgi:hypothetical protein
VRIAAWLIVVEDLRLRPSYPPPPPGSPQPERPQLVGHAIHVLADGTGEALTGLIQIGGPFEGLTTPDT